MKVLVTGKGGKSGSWKIRGEQLGSAIGANVIPHCTDVRGFDVAVVVKRPPRETVKQIDAAHVPLVWDVVDAWPQPEGSRWNRAECMSWLRGMVEWIKPAAIVAATRAMARDCEELGMPVLALPHHARPGHARTPIRPLRVVGYEGDVGQLGAWHEAMRQECAKRCLTFSVKPASLNELDVVVALREADGYAPRNWKSNVKLANAQATGTPIICGPEAGYLETSNGGAVVIADRAELSDALDLLEPTRVRYEIAKTLFAGRLELESVAATYQTWLREVACALAPNC